MSNALYAAGLRLRSWLSAYASAGPSCRPRAGTYRSTWASSAPPITTPADSGMVEQGVEIVFRACGLEPFYS